MTEDRLADFLSQAVPPQGPALSPDGVLKAARRRQHRRRSMAVTGVAGVAAIGAVGFAELTGTSSPRPAVVGAPSPCASASPYAGSDGEQTVYFPTDGSSERVAITEGHHVTVAFACGASGQISAKGSSLQATDSSSEGKGGPAYDVRYLGVGNGVVTITGSGTQGSTGRIVVTVKPTPSDVVTPSPTPTPTTTTRDGLQPVDFGNTTAGACARPTGPVAQVRVNPDVPSPRCIHVAVGQRLRVLNNTNGYGDPGQTIIVMLAGFPDQTLSPGQAYTYPTPLSDVEEPGYHQMRTDFVSGASSLLVDQ